MQISVLVVDDHPVMAESLAAGLAGEGDLCLVGIAASGAEALAIASSRRVDVAVIDTDLGDEDGIHVGRCVRDVSPATHVVHLSGLEDDIERVTEALRGGVRGWVAKNGSMHELLAAVRGSRQQETRIPAKLLTHVFGRLAPSQPGPLDPLTLRQREVLQGLVDGLSRAAIAERLFLSRNTVRTHIQNLLHRLGVHSTLEAVAVARTAGMRAQQRSPRGRHPVAPFPRPTSRSGPGRRAEHAVSPAVPLE
ncbi:MAG: response regulator transcription factor [Frankiaceae bacterium]